VDVNQHLIGSHYSRPIRGYHTLALPEIDVAASNAYSAFEELAGGNNNAVAALEAFWNGWQGEHVDFPGFRIFNKPALIEEQGRHWMGVEYQAGRKVIHNTRDALDADLHAGLWGSLMQPLAGATGYWWWLHVHFDNRYSEYRALANFLAGEDLRPAPGEEALLPGKLTVEPEGALLAARARRSRDRAYVWVFHRALPFRSYGFTAVSGARVSLHNLKAGRYAIEFWDTRTGRKTSQVEAAVAPGRVRTEGGTLEIALPPVTGDLAIKVKVRR
jgi:hypothetical protein